MKSGCSSFAQALIKSRNTFESRYSRMVGKLGLRKLLCPAELSLLYTTAFYAAACNISLNGLGRLGGEVSPEMERNRLSLEWAFMAARDEFFGTAGWMALRSGQRDLIKSTFLTVQVNPDKFAF